MTRKNANTPPDVVAAGTRRWEAIAERVWLEESHPERAEDIRRVWDGLVEERGEDLDRHHVNDAVAESLHPGSSVRALARHEAAHAVVGIAAGRPVHRVWVAYDPGEGALGRAHMGGESAEEALERARSLGPRAMRETMVSEAAIHVAGPVAHHEAEHGEAPGSGWRDDAGEMETARDVLLSPIARDETEADELLDRAVERARAVLAANRDLHDALVAELMERRKLNGGDLERILAEQPVVGPPDRLW